MQPTDVTTKQTAATEVMNTTVSNLMAYVIGCIANDVINGSRRYQLNVTIIFNVGVPGHTELAVYMYTCEHIGQ